MVKVYIPTRQTFSKNEEMTKHKKATDEAQKIR